MSDDWGLLEVGGGGPDLVGDDAVLAAMVSVEAALLRAWAELLGRPEDAAAADLLDSTTLDRRAIAEGVHDDGVAVIVLVAQLRAQLERAGANPQWLHAGTTSQDILDTALMLTARDTLAQVRGQLLTGGAALARLADAERHTVRMGHTLGRRADLSTAGVQAAGWLDGVSSGIAALEALHYPVQFGGAVGTGEQADRISGLPDATVRLRAELATIVGLDDPGRAWHTERTPVASIAVAAATVTAMLGRIGRDLVAGSRESVRELELPGGGGSSAMPHKLNPVDAVVMTAAALQSPGLVSTMLLGAVSADERPAGEWHAEWIPFRGLLRLASTSAHAAARTLSGLRVLPDGMAQNVAEAEAVADEVTFAAADRVVDAALARFATFAGEA